MPSVLKVWEEGTTLHSMNPKTPQPKGFTKLHDGNQILLNILLIPMWISGGYPPGITGSNDASILESGLPAIYGHLTFQTAQQVFILWKMLSKYSLKFQGGLYANSKALG
jgi:hypothetical protein